MNEKKYPDDLDDFTHDLMEGIVGKKNLIFESRSGKPEKLISAKEYKNLAFVATEGRLKLFMEDENGGCLRTGPVLQAKFNKFDENNHSALIETINTQYTITGLSTVQKTGLQGTYDLFRQTEMLKSAIYTAQGTIDRTISTIDQRNESEFSDLVLCRNQLENTKYILASHTDYEANKNEAKGLIEKGQENQRERIVLEKDKEGEVYIGQTKKSVRNDRFLVSWKSDEKVKDFTCEPAAKHFMNKMLKRGVAVNLWHNISYDKKAVWARLEEKGTVIETRDSICSIPAQDISEISRGRV